MEETQDQPNKLQTPPQPNQILQNSQVPVVQNTASFFFRFGAYTVDTIIVSIIVAFLPLGQMKNEPVDFISSIFSFQTIFYLIFFIIYSSYMTYKYQATLGKKLFGLKVIAENNIPLQLYQVILRETVKEITAAITFGIVLLIALTNAKRQTLHDKLAKTYVLKP